MNEFWDINIFHEIGETFFPKNPVTLANSKTALEEVTLFERVISTPISFIRTRYAFAVAS
jgi:hypothetical protein